MKKIVADWLTSREKDVLEMIKSFVAESGCSPTRQEIGDHFGFTHQTARNHLLRLEAKGKIQLMPEVRRGIRIVGK